MATITRIKPGPRLSRIAIHNGTAHFAGIAAIDRSQDLAGQTAQVFARIDEHLADCGSDRTRILSAMILMKDVKRDFAAFNAAWEAWIPAGHTPARATWQADLAAPDILLEIVVVAAVT
jgi:enamine deaminase RidA (YjgF/YER057c/UK114 family)